LNAATRLRHSANATFQSVAGEAILIHLTTGAYYSLNEVGTVFWEMLDGAATIGECARKIAQEYAAPVEQVEADLLEIAGELSSEGLAQEVA
jgi:Coenzyme PQQ synthesis protein D (PqqD)